MKISKRARTEFAFYRDTPLDMLGHAVEGRDYSCVEGHSALECWYAKDTLGQLLQCSEPKLLDKVCRGKKSINLQIQLWAEDIADGRFATLRQAELVDYCHGWPKWIFLSVLEQAGKIASDAIGFAPRFTRFETVLGNWWPPEMDSFDPKI